MKKTLWKEVGRKIFHLLEVPVIIFYLSVSYYFDQQVALVSLTGVLILLLIFEFARLEKAFKLPLLVDSILRKRERNNLTSSIYFLLATIIAFSVYDTKVATAALLMATLGDMVAALLGKKLGKKKIYENKTYVGTFACLTTNFFIGIFFLSDNYWVGALMALAATTTEMLSSKVDDNLTVPIFTGFLGEILLYFIP